MLKAELEVLAKEQAAEIERLTGQVEWLTERNAALEAQTEYPPVGPVIVIAEDLQDLTAVVTTATKLPAVDRR